VAFSPTWRACVVSHSGRAVQMPANGIHDEEDLLDSGKGASNSCCNSKLTLGR
jgi:hypothetical protein